MYGQGSVVHGFTSDSDLDFIAVWDAVPDSATLTAAGQFSTHDGLAMEQAHLDGFDIDIQHVPATTFASWIASVRQGRGWSGDQWPMPIHVAAGLADGLLLIDSVGIGMSLQAELQTPAAELVEVVRHQLRTSTPGFVEALQRSAENGDYWLHDHLAVQFHKLIYTAWFLVEGHYPPFPKHLPQWTSRFDMDTHIRDVEQRSWLEGDRTRKRTALAELAGAVLRLNY